MKITCTKKYIEIHSDTIIKLVGRLNNIENTKAGAFFPFVFISSKIQPQEKHFFINHELIHFRQQVEMFFLFNYIFNGLEKFYFSKIKKQKPMEAYLSMSSEQEAYHNMFNLKYLETRKPFAHLRIYKKLKPVTWNWFLKAKEEAIKLKKSD